MGPSDSHRAVTGHRGPAWAPAAILSPDGQEEDALMPMGQTLAGQDLSQGPSDTLSLS